MQWNKVSFQLQNIIFLNWQHHKLGIFPEMNKSLYAMLVKATWKSMLLLCLSIITETDVGLVSFFNGISTFAGYLMPNPFL